MAAAQAPTVQSSAVQFSNTYCNRTDVSWTVGNGDGRIVIARKDSAVTAVPKNDTFYIANAALGTVNTEISPGQFVVYNGAANSVIVTNLEADTKYHFAVYEFNGSGNSFSFLTSNPGRDSVTTEWLNADFTINQPYQCSNVDTFRFTPNVTQSLSNVVTYNWIFGDGNSSSAMSPTHSYQDSGLFNVTLVASTIGCTHQVTKIDTVAPLPLVNFIFNPDSTNNDRVQCFFYPDGSTNRFSFLNRTISPPIGAGLDESQVLWDFGDGSPPSVQAHVRKKTYSSPGIYRVVLKYTSTLNSYQNVCIDSMVINVEVKPRPLDSTLIFLSDTSMCLQQNEFTFENRTGTPGYSLWEFGDGYSSVGDTAIHRYGAAGDYEVKFSIVDTAGCYDEFTDSVQVVPQPNNYFSGLSSKYCQNDQIVALRPNLPGGVFEGTQVSAMDSTFNPVQLGLNTIRYIYQVGNCRDTSTENVWVMPIPVFDLGNDTSICSGTGFNLIVPRDSSSITWPGFASTDSFLVADQARQYLAIKDNGHCAYRDSINITVLDPPQINLGSDSTLCGGGSRLIDLTSDDASYTWSDGFPGSVREITQSGSYWVEVTNKCGSDRDTVNLEILPYACTLYVPNAFSPNSDGLNDIFRPIGQVEIVGLVIFNRWGEILANIPGPNPEWDGTYQGERVQAGSYFFEVFYMDPKSEFPVPVSEKGHVYVVY